MVVVVEPAGGGGGATTPGLSICPASTQTESVRLRIVAVLTWRKVFNLVASSVLQNFASPKLLSF